VAVLPSIATIAGVCIASTCLGFWKNAYTVSYAYGAAMAIGAYLMLPYTSGLATAHAAAFIFYGVRLNVFLLYRELSLPESIHKMVNSPAGLFDRLKRLPVILGCAFLYFCMLAPLRVTASICPAMTMPTSIAVGVMWFGFGIAALGDTVKSAVKGKSGMNALVTAFPFNFLRHPNYTGEFIGWIASFIASILSAASSTNLKSSLGWLATSAVGTAGICFVLMGAAGGLEKKQKEKYGRSATAQSEYESWLVGSWAGPVIAK
jgi:steroid 5-alpha reductase family enzyme